MRDLDGRVAMITGAAAFVTEQRIVVDRGADASPTGASMQTKQATVRT
jgi:hypothetical protein